MAQRREAITQHLAARLCGQVARRHDSRGARRLERKPVVDGVDRLDEGAWRDDYFSFRHELGGRLAGRGPGCGGPARDGAVRPVQPAI
jgi:hypothetical protein